MDNISKLIPGLLHGITYTYTSHPFDTVKTKLHYEMYGTKIISTIIQTYKHEGIFGFFKGATMPLASNSLRCYQFLLYEYLKEKTKSPTLAGTISGFSGCIITHPFQLIKVNSQTSYISVKDLIKKTYHEKGVRGLYYKFNASLIRDSMFFGVFFGSYDYVRKSLHNYRFRDGIAGGFGSWLCWSLLMPVDYIKTLMLTNKPIILKELTIKKLWAGYIPVTLRIVPVAAATMSVYEYAKKKLEEL